LDSILWDIQTVTINDYSVDLKINKKVLNAYKDYQGRMEDYYDNEIKSKGHYF